MLTKTQDNFADYILVDADGKKPELGFRSGVATKLARAATV